MLDFKDCLKQLRDEKKISQSELARALGVSTSTIGNYEIGLREPDFDTLERLADYFNVPISTLLGDARASRLLAYYDALSGIIQKAARLDHTDRAKIEERIDTMLESDKYTGGGDGVD